MENAKLKEFERNIKEKNIAIIGMGVSNLPLLDYLTKFTSRITVFDQKNEVDMKPEIIKKIKDSNVNLITGKDALKKLIGFDIIFRSPSCRPDTEEIAKEIQRGAILTSEIEMVLKLCPGKIIGVTGTEGKTTTTSLIYAIIKKSGKKCF